MRHGTQENGTQYTVTLMLSRANSPLHANCHYAECCGTQKPTSAEHLILPHAPYLK